MESLILATSLVLTSPADVSSLDNKAELQQLVQQQTELVSRTAMTQVANVGQETELFQAKMIMDLNNEVILIARFEPQTADAE